MTKTDTNTPASTGTAPKSTNVVTLSAKAAQERPSDKVVAFVKRHPVITVAGGIAIGVAVSALIPRKASRKLIGKAVDLAEVAGAAGVVFGKQAGERAHAVSVGARKQASVFAHKAEHAGGVAAVNLEKYGLAAVAAASALGRATAKRASRFSDVAADAAHRISEAAADRAHQLGDAAADRSTKVVHLADDLRKRAKSRR
ncbi:MAG TPA: hypothetical protein VMQ93_00835 [Novosphingobium sp.]|nr:hypothetical protein [Novosphingobium sp.]